MPMRRRLTGSGMLAVVIMTEDRVQMSLSSAEVKALAGLSNFVGQ